MITGLSMPHNLCARSQEKCGALSRRGFPLDVNFDQECHKGRTETVSSTCSTLQVERSRLRKKVAPSTLPLSQHPRPRPDPVILVVLITCDTVFGHGLVGNATIVFGIPTNAVKTEVTVFSQVIFEISTKNRVFR